LFLPKVNAIKSVKFITDIPFILSAAGALVLPLHKGVGHDNRKKSMTSGFRAGRFALLGALCLFTPLLSQAATQTILAQSDAAKLISAGEQKAVALHDAVCIAVVDQSGTLLSFVRMDNAPLGCVDSAILKARAAALYRTPTIKYMQRANGNEPAIATLPGMVPLGGGTPVKLDGAAVGAVGVSGAANPDEVAISEAAALGL